MQHTTMDNVSREIPLTAQIHNGSSEKGSKANGNDKTITIIQPKASDQYPQTEIAHGLSGLKNTDRDTYSTLVAQTLSAKMSQRSLCGGDAIDCAIAAQKENRNELTPAINYTSAQYQNNSKATPTPGNSTYLKDGHYFLALLKSEQTRLLTMAEQAERDIFTLTANENTEISDEILGILRSVSGKTKLLVSQKFKQFEGLCHSNLNPTADEKFATTIEDLQGFWDMINLQIEHVDSLFKDLDSIKANNWQTTKDITAPFIPTGSKLIKRPVLKNGNSNGVTTTKTSPNAVLMAQKREAQRKQLLELKRKNKNASIENGAFSSPIEIYVSENFV